MIRSHLDSCLVYELIHITFTLIELINHEQNMNIFYK